MSNRVDWMFYLAPETWARYKLLDIHDDVKLNRMSRIEASDERARMTESLETLQENLARALLLVHSLTEALVRKGLVTREEIAAVAAQLDMLDGQADGKLSPGTVAGTVKAPDPPDRPLSPHEFLGKLEKS